MIGNATDEKMVAMAEQAREIAKKFDAMTKSAKGEEEKPNLYTAKVKRYRKYVADKLVRVDCDTHVLHSQWILREQALQQCLNYHDPVKWLCDRCINC